MKKMPSRQTLEAMAKARKNMRAELRELLREKLPNASEADIDKFFVMMDVEGQKLADATAEPL